MHRHDEGQFADHFHHRISSDQRTRIRKADDSSLEFLVTTGKALCLYLIGQEDVTRRELYAAPNVRKSLPQSLDAIRLLSAVI